MKKIFYIAFAAAALAAVSCSKNAEFNVDPAEPGLTLTFTCTDMATRGEVDGKKNENRVDRIDYFFFPLGTDGKVADDTKPVYGNYMEIAPEDNQEGRYTEVIEPGVLAKIFPDGATKAMIFAVANYNGEESLISGTAPVTDFSESELTWGYLHGLEVGATFTKDGGPGFGLRWPRAMKVDDPLLYFVMSADTEIELMTTGQYAVKATVPLERLASKVTASFTYENYLERKTYKQGENQGKVYEVINWVPQAQANETRVYLSNAICTTTLGGPLSRPLNPDGGDESAPWSDRDIFEYAYDFMKPLVDAGEVPYYYTYPFKKYEEEAEEAADAGEGEEGEGEGEEGEGEGEGEGEQTASIVLGDDNQPYLKLVLPWYGYKYVGTDDLATVTYTEGSPDWVQYKQKEVYYKIVLPSTTITEPNKIYEYQVAVNIIGSDKEVKLIGEEYIVKDWTSDHVVSSNVATGRYISLEIPKDEYDMYVDEIDINFVSSGTVIPIVEEIYQLNYSSATGVSRDYFMQNDAVPASASQGGNNSLLSRKGLTADDIEGWVTIPAGTSYLKISHEMDNRMTINNAQNRAFDMAPYVFKVRLHLEEADDDFFDRVVTITQYPALYVSSKLSNGYTYVNGDQRPGSVYDDAWNSLGNLAVSGTLDGSGTNNNPYNYIITTTMLSDDLKVQIGTGNNSTKEATILGDPRKPNVDNLDNLALTNYRPANPEGTRTIIAPKLLIASSYGAANSYFDQDAAEKRCASYQENGYPAGRWRMPTLAEMTFMITLSNMGFIPSLFLLDANDYYGYWCANGKVGGDSDKLPYLQLDNLRNTSVRCVYDVWYWGEEQIDNNNNVTTTSPATTWRGFHD